MANKTIVILGGGIGGLAAANALRRRLGPAHRIVLVDKQQQHLFAPSLLWLMVGARRREDVTKDLHAMVEPGVEVVQAQAHELDLERGRVVADGQDLSYDALVVALGAALAPDALPGYVASAHNFYDLDGATALWETLQRFEGGRVAVAVSALPFKCPAAPYEAALLIEDVLRRRGVRGRTEVAVYTPEPQPMPVAGPVLGQAVTALLEQRGIAFHPNQPLQAIDPEQRALVFRDGSRAPFDLLAATPPHRPPQLIKESPLANEAGWIPVDKATLRTRFEHVYALGDVTAITLANGKPLPKAGVFAHGQALAVAQTLTAELQGGQPAIFDGLGYCWLELGSGRAGLASGEFYGEPDPKVRLRRPGPLWHLGKVLFEHYWMGDGLERRAAALALGLGSRLLGVPAAL
ncbi:MAG: NAD(P)/FAD-dependent oxidoreductase [Chloroflexi bacterium]|nr:NAD(P)/FAD-dependent oxidoreductase [Chloroflexota bacterium]